MPRRGRRPGGDTAPGLRAQVTDEKVALEHQLEQVGRRREHAFPPPPPPLFVKTAHALTQGVLLDAGVRVCS